MIRITTIALAMLLRKPGTALLVAVLIGTPNVAAGQVVLLSCSGTLSTKVYGLSSVQNQTLEINLATGKVRGLLGSNQIAVHYEDATTIEFSGPTLFGLFGSGSVDRVSGDLVFAAPSPLPAEGSQVAFVLRCSPAQPRF
jgi:hypothetical protein